MIGMSKTAFIRARIEPGLKTKVDVIFEQLGVSPTQVITMLYKQILRKRELPLEMYLPNKATARAIKEARAGKGVVACEDVDDLFKKLNI